MSGVRATVWRGEDGGTYEVVLVCSDGKIEWVAGYRSRRIARTHARRLRRALVPLPNALPEAES